MMGRTWRIGALVMGVAGHSDRSRTVTREWAAVADPRTGSIRKRRLSGGTLCHGPVLARRRRMIASLTLMMRARTVDARWRARRSCRRRTGSSLSSRATVCCALSLLTVAMSRECRPGSGVRRCAREPLPHARLCGARPQAAPDDVRSLRRASRSDDATPASPAGTRKPGRGNSSDRRT